MKVCVYILYIFVEREKTFFQTTSVSTHYVFDGPMLKKNCASSLCATSALFLGNHLRLAPFNKIHGQGHLPGGFVSIRKNIELDFFPQKNQSVSPWAYFHPQILWSVELMGPKYSKNWCPHPGYIP